MKPRYDSEKELNNKRVEKLLTPSWLSGLLAITMGLVLIVGVILIFSLNNGVVKQQLIGLENTRSSQPALTLPGQAPPGSNNNSLQNTWPLLAFWAVIGLMTYIAIEVSVNFVREARQFNDELNYVHAKRDLILRTTAEYLFIRIGAAIIWLIFIELFFKKIVPLSIVAAHASAADVFSLGGFLDAAFGFMIIVLSMHLHAIFLRLTLRKPRVFSSADYLDV